MTGDLIRHFQQVLGIPDDWEAWNVTTNLIHLLREKTGLLDKHYKVSGGLAVHDSAEIEKGAVIKGNGIIGPGCFVASGAYLRGGVYLFDKVTIGPGCEVKTTVILSGSTLAHFNYVGDSVIGRNVNFEAGAVIANHHNDKVDKKISVIHQGKRIDTGLEKFGAIVGDDCKIGANAVLCPGTVLTAASIVQRLQLIDQAKT